MSESEQHSSFIKTPQQLATVVLLAFVVPVIAILLLVKLVLDRPKMDPAAMTPEAVSGRLKPVGRVEIGAAGDGTIRTGEEIAKGVCLACHATGAAGAPKTGDKAAWAPRIAGGLQKLSATVIKGKGAMPPKGGDASLSDIEVTRAVAYMANQAGASFKEPAAPAQPKGKPEAAAAALPGVAIPAPAPQAAAKPGVVDGRQVYEQTCVACHGAGVAGAPKLGDKAAWAPRIRTGMDQMMASVVKGKGAMPPKAGHPSLGDAQIRAALNYMVSTAK